MGMSRNRSPEFTSLGETSQGTRGPYTKVAILTGTVTYVPMAPTGQDQLP